jgi:hypothetical protein
MQAHKNSLNSFRAVIPTSFILFAQMQGNTLSLWQMLMQLRARNLAKKSLQIEILSYIISPVLRTSLNTSFPLTAYE